MNTLSDLRTALVECRIDVTEERRPVEVLNVWMGGRRIPTATIVCNDLLFEWGHQWEHSARRETPILEVVSKILASIADDLGESMLKNQSGDVVAVRGD